MYFNRRLRQILCGVLPLAGVIILSLPVSAQTFEFKARWPQLSFVSSPGAMDLDSHGNLFVVSEGGFLKLSPAGEFLDSWQVVVDGWFAWGLAIDGQDNVYITEEYGKVKKYAPNGEFVTEWGGAGQRCEMGCG